MLNRTFFGLYMRWTCILLVLLPVAWSLPAQGEKQTQNNQFLKYSFNFWVEESQKPSEIRNSELLQWILISPHWPGEVRRLLQEALDKHLPSRVNLPHRAQQQTIRGNLLSQTQQLPTHSNRPQKRPTISSESQQQSNFFAPNTVCAQPITKVAQMCHPHHNSASYSKQVNLRARDKNFKNK